MDAGTRITIQRPDGTVEIVEKSEYFSGRTQQQMIEATRKAGRGEILSFEIIYVPDEQERLRTERRDLVASIHGAIEDSDAAYDEAHAREDVLAEQIRRQHDGTVKACRAALNDFDARHPEIVEQLVAEKTEQAERFLATD